MFDTVLIASRLWKQMACQESYGVMELSQKEQCLTETCAASDAAQQHPVSAREISPYRAHIRQTTSSMAWEEMSGRKKHGTGPWKVCYDIASSFKKRMTLNCLSPPSFAWNDPRDPFSPVLPWAASTVKTHYGECSIYDSFGFVYSCIFPGWYYVTFFPHAVLASYKYSELSWREVLPISVLRKGI